MEFIFEIIIQLLWEILLQGVVEAFVEMLAHSFKRKNAQSKGESFSIAKYLFLGLICGGLSLLVFPNSFIIRPELRLFNLLITPALTAWLMTRIGRIRLKKGQQLVKIDHFAYAFIFAFAMSLVRFFWSN